MTQVEMKCPLSREDTADVLLDYSAGRLDKARASLLARHMETCDACAAFGVQQAALWSALDEWEPEPVSMDFNRRMWQKIDLLDAAPWHRRLADSLRLGSWKPGFALVAAVVLVIRHGKSSKNVMRRARDLLVRSGAPLAGMVLNAVDLNSPEYYGYYGYTGYSYGSMDAESWETQPVSAGAAGAEKRPAR